MLFPNLPPTSTTTHLLERRGRRVKAQQQPQVLELLVNHLGNLAKSFC